MVKIKLSYTISKNEEMTLTTKEWCKYHADSIELRQLIANKNNVDINDVHFGRDYLDIIDGELDYSDF